jgi:hypothetical protein
MLGKIKAYKKLPYPRTYGYVKRDFADIIKLRIMK